VGDALRPHRCRPWSAAGRLHVRLLHPAVPATPRLDDASIQFSIRLWNLLPAASLLVQSPGGWRRGEMTRIEATAWRPPARLWVDASTVPAVDKTGLTNQAAGAGPAHPPPGLSAPGCKRSPSALLAARALGSARERGYPPVRCATLPAWPGGRRRLRPGGGRAGSPLARELARPGAPAPHQKSGDGAAGERGARPRPRRGGPAPARQLRLACGRRCATGGVCSRRRRSSLPGRGRTR
jgi:hypothetical protein